MMKKVVLGVLMTLALGVGGVAVQPVMADEEPNNDSLGSSAICNDDKIDEALKKAAGCKDTKRLDKVVNTIIEVVLSMTGILAVGVMIYGGSIYLTSNGNTQKLEKAKHVILYGVIGLAVCLLAFAIVSFVSRAIPS